MPKVRRILAHERGCLVIQRDGAVTFLSQEGDAVLKETSATAMGVAGDEVLVAVPGKIARLGLDGHERGNLDAQEHVTALAIVDGRIAVGTVHGDIRLVDPDGGTKREVSLSGLPSAAVEVMAEGPARTLVAGFRDGTVGAWDLTRGSQIHHALLHGPVTFLERSGGKVHALSELGDHVVMDSSVLLRPYCDVLNDVWSHVPVVWEGGRPERRREPDDHRCKNE